MPDSIEGYKYTIFGEYYEAGSREQGKLMFDAFESLIKRYSGCEEKLTQKTSVARAENVKMQIHQRQIQRILEDAKSSRLMAINI